GADPLVLGGAESEADLERRGREVRLLKLDRREQRAPKADVPDGVRAARELLPRRGEDLDLGRQVHLVPPPAAEVAPGIDRGRLQRQGLAHRTWYRPRRAPRAARGAASRH